MMVENAASTLSPEASRRAMVHAILAQCFGAMTIVAFQNNLIFLYLRALGIGASRILLLFSISPLIGFLFILPAAWLADRYGKSRMGVLGSVICGVAIGLVIAGAFVSAGARFWCAAAGIALYGFGYVFFTAGWFALLSPVVPEHLRGRFFGWLRFAWQMVGAVFTGCVTVVVSESAPLGIYIGLLSFVAASQFLRIPFYVRIPEIEKPVAASASFLSQIARILHLHGFASFCAYAFLLHLFVGCCPVVFSLVQKEVHHFSDRLVALNGNLTMIGLVLGFLAGGIAVDRVGAKTVFIFCHFGYGAVLLFFLLRTFLPVPVVWPVATAVFLFNGIIAASSIAFSTEMLSLLPQEGKSVSASMVNMMIQAGTALSGFLSAQALSWGLLASEWRLLGHSMSQYDTILLCCGLMVVLLVVTLGLVPSVLKRKAEWVPRGF